MSLAIVIPNFNKSKYIEQCVYSVLNQTLVPDEIWIIDDCSTDGSQAVIEKLALQDNRIKPIFLEKNGGVSVARNLGIMSATTEYITTLDSDDYFYNENKLENEMKALTEAETAGRVNCFAYSQTIGVDENGNDLGIHLDNKRRFYLSGWIKEPLLARYCASLTTPRDYCIKRAYIINAGLFDENSKYFEDLDLLIRVSFECEAIYTGKKGVAYRQVANGLSQQQIDKYKIAIKSLKIKYYNRFSFLSKFKYYYYVLAILVNRFFRKLRSYL